MDIQGKRLIFGLCVFVGIWNWQIGEVNSSGCHYFSTEQRDWFEALFACQQMHMCLADLHTRVIFDELENKLQERAEFWFGLNVYEKLDFKYISNDRPKEYVPPQSEMSFNKACAFLKPLGTDAIIIGTDNCGLRKRFVCTPSKHCNGHKTNSTVSTDYPHTMPCIMSAEISHILGI
ncbi:uncharacterized protein LOC111079747 [Drosophila obscura]|uniref:uncharacterized protein LOC111079747 n=1 Tax=Drosophila obscura TaxID=7282 RepID=UPI001BB1CD18|nr:uncharacterized protein LOC111079747 [Drosophila obscura]